MEVGARIIGANVFLGCNCIRFEFASATCEFCDVLLNYFILFNSIRFTASTCEFCDVLLNFCIRFNLLVQLVIC